MAGTFLSKVVESSRELIITSELQIMCSLLFPLQNFPPPEGTGLSHTRSLDITPAPQVLVQDVHSDQGPQPPSTAPGRSPSCKQDER